MRGNGWCLLLLLAAAGAAGEADVIQPNLDDGDMQTLTQLLHWSLEHQDLDELHAKAESIRSRGAAGGDQDLLPRGEEGGPRIVVVDPEVERQRIMARAKELHTAMDSFLPDLLAQMRDALAIATDAARDVEARIEALHDLQELVEDLDNAQDIMKDGGLRVVVSLLEDGDDGVRAAAAWVLGTAAQNNEAVQAHLAAEGAPARLIHLLVAPRANATEEQAKALFALSAICRDSPAGSAALLRHGGLPALALALGQPSPRVVRKALTLLTDLARAAEEADDKDAPGGLGAALADALAANGTAVCGAIAIQLDAGVAAADADTVEKALDAAEAFSASAGGACARVARGALEGLAAQARGRRPGKVADAVAAAASTGDSDGEAALWVQIAEAAEALLAAAGDT